MRYDQKQNRIFIEADELVRRAQGELRSARPADEETRVGIRDGGDKPSHLTCEQNGFRYDICSRAHAWENDNDTLIFRFVLPEGMAHPSPDCVRQAKGEAYCAAHARCVKENRPSLNVRVVYLCREGEEPAEETVSSDTLARFFARLLTALVAYHAEELDRVCRRMPTLAAAKYPFPTLREGQGDLISACYSTFRKGKRLFACAPTGIGKTMSVLFPAIRALGEGVFDKIFYFTPKTTVGNAAKDALSKLFHAGADLRAVEILAKERVCPARMICREPEGPRCTLSRNAPERETKAALTLLHAGKPVVTADDILSAATEAKVCPYELSLRYAEFCDVVICDENYLFDLQVYFRRFFSVPGRWCFLVDEAHDLLDRAREAYSLRLAPEIFTEMGDKLSFSPTLSALCFRAAEGFSHLILSRTDSSAETDKDGIVRGFASEKNPPDDLREVVCRLADLCDASLTDPETAHGFAEKREIMSVCRDLWHIHDVLSLYDKRYVTFWRRNGERLSCDVLCLDPAKTLSARLSLGQSAVLFSATLHPADYYRDTLGGRRDDPILQLPSPFERDHLCLTVMDRIRTGYSAREGSVGEVVRTILTTVKAKPGNYMVFCPSFDYLDAVSTRLKKAVPGLATITQSRHMTQADRQAFLDCFSENGTRALIGFCVMGGIYSEGVDLVGKRLIGAIIVGVGLPTLSDEREAMREYYDETCEAGTAYAYTYPGMNRVLQAAGRVIRTETDRGVVVLIDDRFASPEYRKLFPEWWHSLMYAGDTPALSERLRKFWASEDPKKT